MRDFKEYYSDDEILKYLCKIRIKYAQKRSKKILLDKLTTKEHYIKPRSTDYDEQILKELNKMLPPRRKWLSKGQRTFMVIKSPGDGTLKRVKLDHDDKNKEILFNTIKKYRRQHPSADFVVKLNLFIKDIRDSVENNTYTIASPDILPEIKERNKSALKNEIFKGPKRANECRPISRFQLKDRIVLSLVNKFFTELFDPYFEDSSLAFRAVKRNEDGVVSLKHHDAVKRIISFRKQYEGQDLYVAECDMQKFYDSVNHKICIEKFESLITKAKGDNPYIDLLIPSSIFLKYLACYSFRENVLVLNDMPDFWNQHQDRKGVAVKGYFPWIQASIEQSEYYAANPNDRIGVPQGGALSGLIANIMLDSSDKELKSFKDLFYVRYCDDMILMHTNKASCKEAIDTYISSINRILLFNHEIKDSYSKPNRSHYHKNSTKPYSINKNDKLLHRNFNLTFKPFWKLKSKGPYLWGKANIETNSFPWIGFVGYEIKFTGETRIRNRSLKKELEKQKSVVGSIIRVVQKKKNARNNSILRSAIEKLNGMSVGRIRLYDYKICTNKKCWAEGFQYLNYNKYSRKQLKTLDRNKYKMINILKSKIGGEAI
jgi:hypothetical protein